MTPEIKNLGSTVELHFSNNHMTVTVSRAPHEAEFTINILDHNGGEEGQVTLLGPLLIAINYAIGEAMIMIAKHNTVLRKAS